MNNEERLKMVIDLFEFSSTEIFNMAERLTNQQLLIKPAENKWNIAQVLAHLHLSDRGARYAISRNTEPCDRDPLQVLTEFEERKKNDPTAMEAPEKVIPPDSITEEELPGIKLNFITTRREIADFIKKEDPTLLCTSFPHPRIGLLTRIEWVKFIDWHGRHHLKQMQNILMYTPGTFPGPNT